MSIATQSFKALLGAVIALSLCACEEEAAKDATAKPAAKPPVAQPAQTTPPPEKASPPEPKHDCPEGSTGEGSFKKPCVATGAARAMEVQWTGKIADEGPFFRVTNKSPLVILYGKIIVYFYDKAGKQLELKDDSGKTRPHQTCTGKIFGGVMKVAEKAVLTFSCVKKSHIPEGTTQIEGEMQMVGFADPDGEKIDFYWQNEALTPEARPKGGLKEEKKKKK
jgi:hypothetical protein